MQKDLVRLSTVARFSESSPSDFELHGRSEIAVASVAEIDSTMNSCSICCSDRVVVERSQVVDMG